MNYQILQGDALEQLATLPSESVHCCVTSPPYWGLRDYGVDGQIGLEATPAEFVVKMVSVFREVRRVLRDDGTCWVNMGDSYSGQNAKAPSVLANGQLSFRAGGRAISDPRLKDKDLCGMPWRVAFALQDDGWYLRQDIIWAKPNPMPESVTDRCTKAHEYIFLLSKKPRYYFDQEAIRERTNGGSHPRVAGNKSHKGATAYEGGDEHHRTKQGLVAFAEKTREFQRLGKEGPNSRMHQDRDPSHSSARKVKVPGGWDTAKGARGTLHRTDRTVGEYREPGVGPKASSAGSGVKYNESFSAAITDVLEWRNKRDVWTVATEPYAEAHFATFPPALIEPCILAGCLEGGTVLDPFSGSGTTGMVALRHHREYIGIELNPEYVEMSHSRIKGDQPLFNQHAEAVS